jgi:alpha-beta hydrolase superfamily lysophospholipase
MCAYFRASYNGGFGQAHRAHELFERQRLRCFPLRRKYSGAEHRRGSRPRLLLGHSAGGVTSCVYALDHQDEIDGPICESFAHELPAPELAIAVLKGLSHIVPNAHVLKLDNNGFSRDPKVVEALKNDPFHSLDFSAARFSCILSRDGSPRRE